jgi:hypothetical protein
MARRHLVYNAIRLCEYSNRTNLLSLTNQDISKHKIWNIIEYSHFYYKDFQYFIFVKKKKTH